MPIVTAKETFSPGDAMRDIYTHQIITSDFVLVTGDLVSNVRIDEVVRAHKERRRTNKDAIMTMVVKEAGAVHRTRCVAVFRSGQLGSVMPGWRGRDIGRVVGLYRWRDRAAQDDRAAPPGRLPSRELIARDGAEDVPVRRASVFLAIVLEVALLEVSSRSSLVPRTTMLALGPMLWSDSSRTITS